MFHRTGVGFSNSQVYLTEDEVTIASVLNDTVAKFPTVSFGSYPKIFHSYYKTKITLEALNMNDVAAAEEYLRGALPEGVVINYIEDTVTSRWKYIDDLLILTPSLKAPVEEAVSILKQCFDQYSA